jgi:prepilin-type N-terminal cleavage/methylation domain-containing protein
MVKKLNLKEEGFTLIEVLFALAIFSAFLLGISVTISHNVSSSILLKEDLNLHNLAELKMNEVLLGKREFTAATKADVDSGSFEIEGLERYKFEVRISPTEFPDFSQIMGKSEDQEASSGDAIQKLIFDKLKKNLEEMIWQVNVKVTNTEDDYSYELHAWINKANPKLDTNFSF